MTVERWLPIQGYEGCYEVSDLGRFRSLDRIVPYSYGGTRPVKGRPLKRHSDAGGYQIVILSRLGRRRTYLAHRLVLTAFVGPPADGIEACHNNGVRDDNRLINLRWDTRSANRMDAVRHRTHRNTRKSHCLRNHEFTPENTYVYGPGWRQCKACNKARDAKRCRAAVTINEGEQ